MLRTRIIPCLLLRDSSLVKPTKFDKFTYIGDPLNTCRIFNELEVDEMMILDITASREGREPNYKILGSLVSECFMPLSYGGGITSLEQTEKLFFTGFEKIVLNSILFSKPQLILDIANTFGSQSIVASIDVRKGLLSGYTVYSHSGTQKQKVKLLEWAKYVEELGAGEIILTNIDREGTWSGFDTSLVKMVSDAVGIPVIAHGGAGRIEHIAEVVTNGSASAVSIGSMVVFQNKGMGVLVNFPDKKQLDSALNRK
ncbi:AglZ/HisF2 family acetamidino modification protein [Paenibacillus sedimenti]|uniref:Imidazole glycerol phosphate synthase subunit HisF n=1 Tax=Paenibacillus sedimenti TaxID=2770274 RepID=A0A926KTZ7_9BACL|nr:AglZ/HisF2 family acetamidino modification protein [Paenibacillus sedimenti]MBD0384167.1 imidazole glycerol phosphate synthase subunit HisF [Paenibacillus sedimenti]